MPDQWLLEYESPTGATYNQTQPYLPANWSRATVTLRRRAPHTISLEIPRWTHHRLTDFLAGRLWRLSRNGAYWQTGFLDAPSLGGYDAATGRFETITLAGWGSAYALALTRGVLGIGVGIGATFASGSRPDAIVSLLLDFTTHGLYPSDAAWFPSAGRTIWTSGTTFETDVSVSGSSPIEAINDAVDIDGATWRAGINASGAWTFRAGTTVDQTLTSSIVLVDNGNCRITSFGQDGSQIATAAYVVSKVPLANTIRLAVDAVAGTNTLNVTSATGIVIDDVVVIGPETYSTRETGTVSSVRPSHTPYPQVLLVDNLTTDRAAGTSIVLQSPGTLRSRTVSASSTVRDNHHEHGVAIFNDQLTSNVQRDQYGATYIAAYNHVRQSATVEITDPGMIEAVLAAGAEPGDTVSLRSDDQDLSLIYAGTTVTIQEMRIDMTPTMTERIVLTVGDPREDALTTLDRRIRSAHQFVTAGIS